jgi:ferrous iron transport protein A
MKCSFCQFEFSEEAAEAACGRCALFGGCRFLRCPRCGFEMPRTPALIKLMRRWIDSHSRRHAAAKLQIEMPLARLGTGGSAVVLNLTQSSNHERSKLMALGIMPGTELRLVQKFPSFVVSVGYTQLAVDKETAAGIMVRPDAAGQRRI